jgi:hypothetical protein
MSGFRSGCGARRVAEAVRSLRRAAFLLLPVLLLASACARPARQPLSEAEQFQLALRELLNVEQSRAGYHDMRVRVLGMGPDVDPYLVALAQARTIAPVVRSNALVLLAERRAPGALQALERSLGQDSPPRVRAAAVVGAQRLAPHVPEAARLVRLGVTDPSRTVRLTALIALDVGDVEVMRASLNRERDADVRQVARQLIRIAESRGAPLAADARGILRSTVGTPLEPQIVFRPAQTDTGDGDCPSVTSGSSFPAPWTFRSRPRRAWWAGWCRPSSRRIRPRWCSRPTAGSVCWSCLPGTFAPSDRALPRAWCPFTDSHRLPARARSWHPGSGWRPARVALRRVPRPFTGNEPAEIGELRARMRRNSVAGYTPVRRMVVVETPEGFGLRADGVTMFVLPDFAEGRAPPIDRSCSPIWSPAGFSNLESCPPAVSRDPLE